MVLAAEPRPDGERPCVPGSLLCVYHLRSLPKRLNKRFELNKCKSELIISPESMPLALCPHVLVNGTSVPQITQLRAILLTPHMGLEKTICMVPT